jgi:hypothetical protein
MDRDPYVDPRCDPWKRLFNYPPLWLEARRFGASAQSTNLLGVAMAGLFSAALILAFRATSWRGSLIVVVALLSPAIMFGLERGNVDTLLFSLLAFGLYATRRGIETSSTVLRCALIIALTALKVYPVAACATLIRDRRNTCLVPLFAAGLAFVAFVWTSWSRIPSIFSNTPFTSYYSYGAGALLLDMAAWLDARNIDPIVLRTSATVTALLLGIGVAVWAALGSPRRLRQVLPPLDRRDFADDLCLAGLSIFCLTFLLGSNFHYRLVFLAGALPALIRAFEQAHDARLLVAPCAVLALLWATRLPHGVGHALGWIGYLGACAWLAQALVARCAPHTARDS